MIWVVAMAFEKDVFGPDATADTSTLLGVCFHGWSLSDSLDVRWGITGGDVGGGVAGYISYLERDTSATVRKLKVRQAFCKARKILERYYYNGFENAHPYVGWVRVYPKDELSSCGEIVLNYLKGKYPQAFNYDCGYDYGDCTRRAAMNLRKYLFEDVEEFLTERTDTSPSPYALHRNVAVVVMLYESLALYAEKNGLKALEDLK